MSNQMILRVVARWNIPFMVVFGMYVITHGEIGPGGGFQGGVIVAAAFILYGLIDGADKMRELLPRRVTDIGAAMGVMLYAGVGIFSMLRGYEFLDHAALWPANPGGGEPWGMTLVEYGVGLTVTCVMVTVYNEFTEGTGPEHDVDGDPSEGAADQGLADQGLADQGLADQGLAGGARRNHGAL